MVSARLQRQIDRSLDEAEQAIEKRDWGAVRDAARAVLRLDPENSDVPRRVPPGRSCPRALPAKRLALESAVPALRSQTGHSAASRFVHRPIAGACPL